MVSVFFSSRLPSVSSQRRAFTNLLTPEGMNNLVNWLMSQMWLDPRFRRVSGESAGDRSRSTCLWRFVHARKRYRRIGSQYLWESLPNGNGTHWHYLPRVPISIIYIRGVSPWPSCLRPWLGGGRKACHSPTTSLRLLDYLFYIRIDVISSKPVSH